MPQFAIRGIYKDGAIIPLEEIPDKESMNVIIVFIDNDDEQSRYAQEDWRLAEKQASEDYKAGKTRSAGNIDEMFEQIEKDSYGNQMVSKF